MLPSARISTSSLSPRTSANPAAWARRAAKIAAITSSAPGQQREAEVICRYWRRLAVNGGEQGGVRTDWGGVLQREQRAAGRWAYSGSS